MSKESLWEKYGNNMNICSNSRTWELSRRLAVPAARRLPDNFTVSLLDSRMTKEREMANQIWAAKAVNGDITFVS